MSKRLDRELARSVESRLPDLWIRLQELLADAFWRQGLSVCNRILELCDKPLLPEVFGVQTLDPFVAELCGGSRDLTDVKALTAAIVDTVLDAHGTVRRSLLDTVAKFVVLCSLGVHPEAYEETNARLAKWMLLLDTHVVLSWMCEGERDHAGTAALLRSWRSLGRPIGVPHPVVEEATYHAWISENEARQVRVVPGHAPVITDHVAENAFLRAFLFREDRRFSASRWNAFRSNFVATHEADTSSMRDQLSSLGATVLEASASTDTGLADNRSGRSKAQRPAIRMQADGSVLVEKKNVWDDELLRTALASQRRQEVEGGGVILLSKSSALRRALDERLPQHRVAMKTCASLGLAMAMLPGGSLSLDALRELLFDDQPFLSLNEDTKRVAARLVEESYGQGLDQLGRRQLAEQLSSGIRVAFFD